MSPAAAFSRPGFELMLQLPWHRQEALLSLLRAACLADPRFPDDRVCTIYFDTPGWRGLRDKVDSDYLKTKVRLRWYETARPPAASEAFLEVKRKVGAVRSKLRLGTGLSGEEVRQMPLADGALRDLVGRLAEVGYASPTGLRPVIELCYRRRRFVDPDSAARLALDTEIGVRRAHPSLRPPAPDRRLPVAVLEVKGKARSLPPRLRAAIGMGARKASLSKYAAAYDLLSSQPS